MLGDLIMALEVQQTDIVCERLSSFSSPVPSSLLSLSLDAPWSLEMRKHRGRAVLAHKAKGINDAQRTVICTKGNQDEREEQST